ncbi:hypothetical protein KY290_018045 [Solanum tuberosum]|uniref:Uncharacterized protein n=1 Tax=Solanum tuberosum TaxID=4113 RepID=A0ABQ7VD24_SOLTU|nr:hypothetical protein KY285_017009 [Solanum tuberosum]KAH0761972.1 hypothetical protein KY290_018045 [Solanum tuberosum]
MDGLPLYIGEKYIIHNPLIGGGSVYLANIGHHECPNTVLQLVPIPGLRGNGTPVKFLLKVDNDDDIKVRETDAIDIMFSMLGT